MDLTADKRKNKWESDFKRRTQVAKAIDFYNNQQEPYTDDFLKSIYKAKAYNKLLKYMECDSITQNIIDDMSILFQGGLVISTGVIEIDRFIADVFDYTQFDATSIKLDRLVNLSKKLALVPFYDLETEQFSFDIITGDKAFITQSETNPLIAKEVYYSTGVKIDSPYVADQVNIYKRYTKDTMDRVEIGSSGEVIKTIETLENPYRKYNEVPFVWFYDDMNIDTFWSECGNNLIKHNLDINRLLTNFNLMLDYQSFATLVTSGLSTSDPIYIGAQFHINLPINDGLGNQTQPDAKYITPNAPIKEFWDVICAKAVKCAKSVGLSAQAYQNEGTGSSFNSGYQLKLSKIDIINKNVMRKPYMIKSMKRLVRMLLLTSNIAKGTSFQWDTVPINIRLNDPAIDLSPTEKETIRGLKQANGTWSAIRSLQEDNPDLSPEQVKQLYLDIQAENNMSMNSNPLFKQPAKDKASV